MKEFVEQRIIGAVRKLLTEKVNEMLNNWNFFFPLIEFSNFGGDTAITPVISLSSCELSEKERVIRQEAYSLSVAFEMPDMPESEYCCYVYSAAVCMALRDDPALGGVADRAVVTGKKYVPPKKPHCGEGWGLVVSLRITVES